jgi:hypothetical protein
MTQTELIESYFKSNPNRDISHPEVVDWSVNQWKLLTGRVLRDPDRAIRRLHEDGKLVKISKGVYKYDPTLKVEETLPEFTTSQKREIILRDGGRCIMCGSDKDIHVDHIVPKSKGGTSDIQNGQLLCSQHNLLKKNLNQLDVGKKMFTNLRNISKDESLKEFFGEIISIYNKWGY